MIELSEDMNIMDVLTHPEYIKLLDRQRQLKDALHDVEKAIKQFNEVILSLMKRDKTDKIVTDHFTVTRVSRRSSKLKDKDLDVFLKQHGKSLNDFKEQNTIEYVRIKMIS